MDNNTLFSSFAPVLRALSHTELEAEIAQPQRLLVSSNVSQGKKIEVAYAPFDYVNPRAEIVIVGLTPGRQQMANALRAARRSLDLGHDEDRAMREAKVVASFSGPMRANLVAMLDEIGANKLLGVSSTASLWGSDADRVHFTSILRYPVFVNGANYSGSPSPTSTSILRSSLLHWFASEMKALPNACFVPLGPVVSQAAEEVAQAVGVNRRRVLSGLPHPSGANAERIAFFLGRKRRNELSNKVDPDKLMAARGALSEKIATLLRSRSPTRGTENAA